MLWGPWGERGFGMDPEGREFVQGTTTTVGEGAFAEPASAYSRDASTVLQGPVRGAGFGFGSFDAFTWNLGWDCYGCATELTADPFCPG